MKLSSDLLKQYNQTRHNTDKSLVCHAPFVNLNFEQTGNVRACCYNIYDILGKWPNQTIREIWDGQQAKEIRSHIKQNDLGGGCATCAELIETGSYEGVHSKMYDLNVAGKAASGISFIKNKLGWVNRYPKVMEFELSNQCNLECVMCNGHFSSSIRKNREKLPPIISPYNDKFVDELEEFLPHLTDAKFLGGEPFMIDIYLKIWERIKKVNPKIRIHITTNGTFLNNRIKDLLESLNAGIILSLDSVVKETYEKIRVNSHFEKVMANLEYFSEYTKRKNTFVSIAVCPMLYNWKELPEMLRFCMDKNFTMYFNTVFYPAELSLRNQSPQALHGMITFLEKQQLPTPSDKKSNHAICLKTYNDFLSLLKGWQLQQEEATAKVPQLDTTLFEADMINETWSEEKVAEAIFNMAQFEQKETIEYGHSIEKAKLQSKLTTQILLTPEDKLGQMLTCYLNTYQQLKKLPLNHAASEKITKMVNIIQQHPKQREILKQISLAPPLTFASLIANHEIEDLMKNSAWELN